MFSKVLTTNRIYRMDGLLGFNTTLTAKVIIIMVVGDAHVFPGFLTPVLIQLFFPKPPTLFSHASAEVRGKNTPERKFASIGDQTHNHQVMSPTCSPQSHPGKAESTGTLLKNPGSSKRSFYDRQNSVV